MMKVINTGTVRSRIEGYGYVAPGRSINVSDDIGRQLCVPGTAFKEVKPVSKIAAPAPEVKKPVKKSTRKTRKKKT